MKQVHVVGAVIENEQGEILCALRSEQMTLPNVWEFPGGKIEQGESKEQALIREIQEELGCTIAVFEQVADTTHTYEQVIVRLETFLAKITKGQPTLSEHAEMRWVKRANLKDLNWAPADIPAIECLMQQEVQP